MAGKTFSTYSLSDVVTTFNHPKCGKATLSEMGGGRITISHAGDMTSATTTATGYVVMNKLVAKNGSVALEIPVNSDADNFMRKYLKYLKTCKTEDYATASLQLKDTAANRTITLIGVAPQKEPDESYDQTAGNRQYNLLYAEMTTK